VEAGTDDAAEGHDAEPADATDIPDGDADAAPEAEAPVESKPRRGRRGNA
ncbi:hypothetical protein HPY25_11430, partial [Methylobacterium sp. IIF4SW-B5]|nr:hypothetical protein [Methylobacterium ajmalii]